MHDEYGRCACPVRAGLKVQFDGGLQGPGGPALQVCGHLVQQPGVNAVGQAVLLHHCECRLLAQCGLPACRGFTQHGCCCVLPQINGLGRTAPCLPTRARAAGVWGALPPAEAGGHRAGNCGVVACNCAAFAVAVHAAVILQRDAAAQTADAPTAPKHSRRNQANVSAQAGQLARRLQRGVWDGGRAIVGVAKHQVRRTSDRGAAEDEIGKGHGVVNRMSSHPTSRGHPGTAWGWSRQRRWWRLRF